MLANGLVSRSPGTDACLHTRLRRSGPSGATKVDGARPRCWVTGMGIQPIFVFSITRSGSTLVQRVIAAHDGVATVSEPWLLLPFLYALRREGVAAEYTHPLMVSAVEDFCKELPGGSEDYREELRAFALRMYEKAAAPGARYFLDKSPPYYFIADEIMRLFPEGKFVFLWRNPLSIIASIIETWQSGRWSPTLFRQDLFIGLPRLVSAYLRNSDRAYAVRFEDLLQEGERPWRGLMEHLGIEFDPAALADFSEVKLHGRMGDQVGSKRYMELSAEPARKWARTLANPLRRAWCRRYLRFLGDERLSVMGYDRDELLRELDGQPSSMASLLPDVASLLDDLAREPVRVRMRRQGIGGPNAIRELLRAQPTRPPEASGVATAASHPSTLPISVIVPAYNRADMLGRALSSVLSQEPSPADEVIVVDDGSDDDTARVATEMGVKLIRHPQNLGLSAARNTGLLAARHSWVALLDSDDEWLPDHLAGLWALRGDHVLLAGSSIQCGEDPAADRFAGPVTQEPMVLRSGDQLIYPSNIIPVSASMFQRELALEVGGFRAHRGVVEDLDMWLRLLERGTGLCSPRVSIVYHLHAGQMSMQDLGTMHRGHAEAAEAHLDRVGGSRAPLLRREGVAAWDNLRLALSAGELSEAARRAGDIAARPQRARGVIDVLAQRYRVRRRSAALREAGVGRGHRRSLEISGSC